MPATDGIDSLGASVDNESIAGQRTRNKWADGFSGLRIRVPMSCRRNPSPFWSPPENCDPAGAAGFPQTDVRG